jgi:hypothetical protein
MRTIVMPTLRPASAVFEQEFLQIRAKILEIASALDRLDRADGSLDSDPRRDKIRAAIETLLSGDDDRAEQVQLIFSRPYDDEWQEKFGVG